MGFESICVFDNWCVAVLSGALVVALGCGDSGTTDNGATGGAGGSGGNAVTIGNGGNPTTSGSGGSVAMGGSGGAMTSGSCTPDPLHTGESPPAGDDEFDCAILTATQKYAEPDAMIFKAIIHTESRFAYDSVACPNLPCGTPNGWTTAESGCYGLMQIVPACGPRPDKEGELANGHPNLTTDKSSPDFANSIFNPVINIDIGISGVADNRKQEQKKFAGCTPDQYTLMAIGDYNSYGSTKSCTVYNTAYDDEVLKTYRTYAQEAGWAAHAY